ncbi:MAG: BrnA antitoxin family protein [Candidatus Tectomicrobia bacterium]|uniref:BrnA antitoxin family protein n=1 Tax=Tectimicrobiota bacterium TaxID=2528274 RepID=A0A937W2P9_UNCTE|nr:BrnA antitoxin family protein [Candidatus Tectomicrobia bacterium]
MNNDSSSDNANDRDEYPTVTAADLDRAVFRIGHQPAPHTQRVTIMLDTVILAYCKAQAGERGYQTLINETLRHAIMPESLEETLRRVLREELQRPGRRRTTRQSSKTATPL